MRPGGTCGSGNAVAGAYLAATGMLARTGGSEAAAQGAALGRDGRVAVEARAKCRSAGRR